MESSSEPLQAQLLQCIQDSLANFLLSNAIFLAERLYALNKSEDNLHVLATCFYRSGKPQKAYSFLKPSLKSPKSRYLFSLCCFDLGKYQEAEHALLFNCDDIYSKNFEHLIPNGAYGLLLLGRIYQTRGQKAQAIHVLRLSLNLNPFLFQSFTILCQLGCDDNPESFFKLPDNLFAVPEQYGSILSPDPVTPFITSLSITPSVSYAITPNKSSSFTPIKPPAPIEPTKKKRNVRAVLFPADETPTPAKPKENPREGLSQRSNLLETPQKPSFNPDWTPLGGKEEFVSTGIVPHTIPENNLSLLREGSKSLLSLLRKFGTGYQHMCQYRCKEAISCLKDLPDYHYETGWVLSLIGRAHLELAEYPAGRKIFEKIQRLEPHRTEGMEYYSTILWYLHQQVDLSYLAHKLVEFDRQSPESWCVVGNCFSLQNEHLSALKIFKRAIQLNPNFAYAYTLSGHEYLAIDDLEKAAVCFRNAIQVDERHYNAWYGLGMIYFRQEQLTMAEFHFNKAVSIHKENSVLHYHISMVQFAQHRFEESYETAKHAVKLCPTNNMAIFQQARALSALCAYEEALETLEMLNERVPKQARIYYALGRLYKILDRIDDAARALTIAQNLDPQNSNVIKLALDRLEQPDDENEEIFDLC